MIFALWDYRDYRAARGRYGTGAGASGMAVAYRDKIPQEVIAQLEVGDSIMTQRLDSVFSWGTMYFASAPIDHIGIYVGDGKVMHMTLSGVKRHDINTLAKGARILPARINYERLKRSDDADPSNSAGSALDEDVDDVADDGGFINRKRRPSHRLPPKMQLVWVAIRLMLGFYVDRYRWKFSADIALAAAIIDLPLYLITGWIFASPIAASALVLTGWNLAINTWRRQRHQPYELLSHPDIFWRHLHGIGGTIFTTLGPLSISEFGLLPLAVFRRFEEALGLGGEGTDDGSDDQL